MSERFNPRLPRGRRRAFWPRVGPRLSSFNPRLPRGRRRRLRRGPRCEYRSFNPRLPRGRRPAGGGDGPGGGGFNPRLPRGRRRTVRAMPPTTKGFNPRLPRGRRRAGPLLNLQARAVSIRASRAGGDGHGGPPGERLQSFNPRLPRGRRPTRAHEYVFLLSFQSAPPAREATRAGYVIARPFPFQSAPPAREATVREPPSLDRQRGFNPRLPRGRRRVEASIVTPATVFQSAPPAREATVSIWTWAIADYVSIRASRAGGDRLCRGRARQ